MIVRYRSVPLLAAVAFISLGACSKSERVRGPEAGEIPESVKISESRVTLGLPRGKARRTIDVASFSITKSPVTVWHYRRCVEAGACSPPRPEECGGQASVGSTYDVASGERLPMTCVSAEQATAYCAWVGGRLPTATEWQFATRGSDPHLYAWGDTPPTCAQHPNAFRDCCTTNCGIAATHSVATHRDGAGPTGVTDVLLTPSELLAPSDDNFYGACSNHERSCVVFSSSAAAFDGFAVVGKTVPLPDAAFRCAWEVAR